MHQIIDALTRLLAERGAKRDETTGGPAGVEYALHKAARVSEPTMAAETAAGVLCNLGATAAEARVFAQALRTGLEQLSADERAEWLWALKGYARAAQKEHPPAAAQVTE